MLNSFTGLPILTVSEITQQIKEHLEGKFSEVWVTGEVSNFRVPPSGHQYFVLKDDKAQMRGVMFRGMNSKLKFVPEDGLEVLCFGTLSVYETRGEYQLIIRHMEPKGIGALQLAFEQLKKKLEAEGLFDEDRKRPLPVLPRKIGIITSPTGAAIQDMIQILTRRFPNIEILINPVLVQGDEAAGQIAAAIAEMNRRDDLDLLIVGRGGGSIEDLWAFNEEVVARAIFASKLPVISAVGHETDFTIADFVADLRAPTPSAAAELAVPVRDDLLESLVQSRKNLKQTMNRLLENLSLQVRQWKNLLKDPSQRLADQVMTLDRATERLQIAWLHALQTKLQTVQSLSRQMKSLNPKNILARGYAIVMKASSQKPLSSASGLKAGDTLTIHLHKDELDSTVVAVRKT